MLSVAEALAEVLKLSVPCSARQVPLPEALGLVLAEDVASDIDSPPHDKSLVDGYAIVAADFTAGPRELDVLEEVTAGQVPTRAVASGQAARIMTGAPISPGADAVVMVEQSELLAADSAQPRVRLHVSQVSPGQNIMRRAVSIARGQQVLSAGTTLGAVAIGVLAEVGRAQVRVVPRPALAVLSTGDELVPAAEVPAAGQIRNSNGPLLLASATLAGATGTDLGIARDTRALLRNSIEQGLRHDVLVLSGGVSAGVLDLVPSVLAELGVEQVFHKINLKPGKPLWFGVYHRGERPTLVFGLPGNPVSSLVCFHLFVRPALAKLSGRLQEAERPIVARLTAAHRQRGERVAYYPGRLTNVEGRDAIEPLRWQGSGDLRTLLDANALAIFPPGDRAYLAGDSIEVLPLWR